MWLQIIKKSYLVVEDCGAIPDLEDKEGEVSSIPYITTLFAETPFQTALHKAALNGHLGVISYLVDAGAEVHARDGDGWTALHNACSKVRRGWCSYFLGLVVIVNRRAT